MPTTPRACDAGWWTLPDRFDRISGFPGDRGLIRNAQVSMAVASGSAALVPLSGLIQSGPGSTRSSWTCITIAAFTLGLAVAWLVHWPSRRQSTAAVPLGIACVATWSATRAEAADAAMACTAMAITGAYLAFVHGPRLLALNSAVAIAITAAAAVRLYRHDGLESALTAFWLVVFPNLSVPVAIWVTTEAVGLYFERAQRDPLTELLNRRGFVDTISSRIAAPDPDARYLSVQMIDLDDFKRINDTHGHPVGDRVLQSVAELLREHAPPAATICRAGGEEFLIASLSPSVADGRSVAERIRAAIASTSHAMTASVGSVGAALDGTGGADVVEGLILAADRAMYAAKRNGGSQVQHA